MGLTGSVSPSAVPGPLLLAHAVLLQVLISGVRPATSYRALELGVPVAWLGALSASFVVLPLLLAAVAGRVTDRLGERSVLNAGGLLVVVAALGFVAAGGTVTGLVVASAVLGLGHLLCLVGEQSLVATGRSGQLDAMFGYYAAATALGHIIGPLLLAAGDDTGRQPSTGPVFLAAAGIAVVLLLITPGLGGSGPAPRRQAQPPAPVRAVLRLPGLGRAVLTSVAVLGAVDLLVVYLPALGSERGLPAWWIGALLAMRAAAAMAVRLLLGPLARLLGGNRLLAAGTVLAAVAVAALAAPVPSWTLIPAVVVAGAGLGVGQPLTMSWIAGMSPSQLRATAVGVRLTGNRLGQLVIPAAAGLLAVTATAAVFWASAAALLGAALLPLAGHRGRHRPGA